MGIGKIFSTTIDDLLKGSGKSAGSAATKSVSKAATNGGGFLTKVNQGFMNTPVFAMALPVAFEIPALIQAYQNGDFGAQLGRSFCRVGMATLGGSIAMGYVPGGKGGFFTKANFASMGTGMTLGMGGDWLGNKMGQAIFGKSYAEQQTAMMQQQQQMQAAYAQQQQIHQASQMQEAAQIRNYIETGSWGPPQHGLSFSSLQSAGGGYPMGGSQSGYSSPMYGGPSPLRPF